MSKSVSYFCVGDECQCFKITYFLRALSKVVGEHPDTWDDYLDAVIFGLRTKKQMTTKYSPYFLMFGREARYPSQVPEHYMVGF